MTALAASAARTRPMPARRRFGIATASSITFHAALLLIVGLLGARPHAAEQLIPIEMTVAPTVAKVRSAEEVTARVPVTAGSQSKLTLGAGDPRGTRSRRSTPAFRSLGAKHVASSGGGRLPSAPAPPRVMTSARGTDSSGPIGAGRDPAGPGGRAEVVGGPSYGAGIADAGGPLAVYPKDALDQDLEGAVTVTISVGADGSMKSVSVTHSSGQKLLDDAAVRAIKSGCAFTPAMQKGKAVAGTVTVTFVFSGGKVKRG